MRHTLVLLLLLAACDPFAEDDTNTDTDDAPVAVAQCSETYTVPGPYGTIKTGAEIAAHEATFGSAETVGEYTLGPDPMQVHLGWPGRDTSNSISFVWRTDRGTLASQVMWGEGDALDHTSEGVSFVYGGTTADQYRVHELKLCGRLTPGTTYSYKVGGEGHWSDVYQFTTPQAPGTFDTFTVAIAGDSRGSYEDWGTLVAKMESFDPDFYLFSGDMVEVGGNEDEWLAWWEASGDTFARKVFVPAHGNHEFLATNYFAQFSLPNNEQWFSLDFGNARVLSLNDTVALPTDITNAQVDFIRSELSSSTIDWKIVEHHQPAYSICTRHGSDMELRENWVPVFDEVEADLVLAGHNHIYERTVPIRSGGEVSAGQGTQYIVTGGAGAPLYPESEGDWFNVLANPVEHYIIAEFGPDEVAFTVRDMSDTVIDTFSIPR